MSQSSTAPAASTSRVAEESALRYFIAVELALLVAVSNFLLLNEQSVFQLDSVIAIGMLAATGAIFSTLYFWENRHWRAVLQTAFVFLAIDLIGNDLRVAAIASAIVPAVIIIKDRSLLVPASVFLGAMLASSLAGIGTTAPFKTVRTSPQKAVDSSRPTILHLVLDEHIGIDGLLDPDAAVAHTQSRLKQAYIDLGFRVYDRAFSEHFHTVNALSWVTNYGAPSKNIAGRGGARIHENRYFASLNKAGYQINVTQTAFANFCAGQNVSSCTTYNQQSLEALLPYHLSELDRSKVIYFKVLDQSQVLLRISGWIDLLVARLTSGRTDIPQSTLKLKSRTNTFAGLAAFDDLIAKLATARSGEVYFAHILLPHTPYVVRSNCSPKPYGDWEDRDARSPLPTKQRRYLDQVWCSARKVREAIVALEQSPAAGNYIVIIHGDHGSRLTKADPDVAHLEKYDAADMIAGFSTLFAIRASGVDAGSERQPGSVASLLRQFAESEFKVAPLPSDLEANVYLDDENWKPVRRVALPPAWLKSE